MELAPGWTTIVACPVGGRDVVLFYDSETGRALTAYIDLTGVGIPLKTFTLSPGWSHIAFCNRRLLFFNESNGLATVATIERDGAFAQKVYATTSLDPGWADIVSDGHYLRIRRDDSDSIYTLGPGDFYPLVKFVRGDSWLNPERGTTVAGCDLIAHYDVDYRNWASFWLRWIDADGKWHGRASIRVDPNWTTVVLSNGYLLFYDEGAGGGKIVIASPDDWLDDLPWTSAAISPLWSHIIPIGTRLLFYAQYNGDARIGYISHDGEFSGEARL
jgi:hypothetical protein